MKKKMFLAFLLTVILAVSSLPTNAFAVNVNGEYGLIPLTKEEIESHLYSNSADASSLLLGNGETLLAANSFPSSVDLSTSQYFPPIKSQGSIGSCAAFSTTYYQFTYEKNKMLNISSKTDASTWASPLWTYSMGRSSLDNGMQLSAAYQILKYSGAVSWEAYPHPLTATDPISRCTSGSAMIDALNVKLQNWYTFKLDTTTASITNANDSALSTIKALLYNGKVLSAGSYGDPHKDVEVGTASNGEKIIYRLSENLEKGHAWTVVGYNDNITCDVNGDGVIESAERGAFKVANSWGTSFHNNGYTWVLYDALNTVSAISGNWEQKYTVPRRAMFAHGTSYNTFTSISVKERKPMLIGKITLQADRLNELEARIDKTHIYFSGNDSSKTTESSKTAFGGFSVWDFLDPKGSAAPYNGSIYVDYNDVSVDFDTDCIQTTWGMSLCNLKNSDDNLRNVSVAIIDNIGNTIAKLGSVDKLTETASTFEKELTFLKGDVNYDGQITNNDALLVLRYSNDLERFSNLQTYLGDMDGDGEITVTDAEAVLRKSVGYNSAKESQ